MHWIHTCQHVYVYRHSCFWPSNAWDSWAVASDNDSTTGALEAAKLSSHGSSVLPHDFHGPNSHDYHWYMRNQHHITPTSTLHISGARQPQGRTPRFKVAITVWSPLRQNGNPWKVHKTVLGVLGGNEPQESKIPDQGSVASYFSLTRKE